MIQLIPKGVYRVLNYAILANPGHNRVYYKTSEKISVAEMNLACSLLSVECYDIEVREIMGVRYICFKTDIPLSEDDCALIKELSFMYALFLVNYGSDGGIESFVPQMCRNDECFDRGMNTVLKYSGKTNEVFTRFMINAARFSGGFPKGRQLSLLDPVCGKGTTLFEAIILGIDVAGIDIIEKPVSEANTYIKKFFETERVKHAYSKENFNIRNKDMRARMYNYEYSRTRAGMREPRKLVFVAGDNKNADAFFGKKKFDLVIGDLPYGVAHSSTVAQVGKTNMRNPSEMLKIGLPSWRSAMKDDGVLGLSWNTFLVSRDEMTELLESRGFKVFEGDLYEGLAHRVDQGINRDAIFAKKA